MPHESTVLPEHIELPQEEQRKFDLRSRRHVHSNDDAENTSAVVDNHHVDRKIRVVSLIAETPKMITHHHDDDELDATVGHSTVHGRAR